MRYCFDNLELDLDTFELRRDGEVIPIRKKTFDVLCYLIEHHDRVVTKHELLDKLWAGEHVNESTIPWYISNLRKTLGQERAGRSPVETVHGRGYRFKSEFQIIEKGPPRLEYHSLMPPSRDREVDPFVGREEVMARLIGAVDGVSGGRGNILMLRGEAGIGKTRCAAEFSSEMSRRGVSVWMGRCPETGGQPAFWPWIQILRNAASERPGDSPLQRESARLLSLLVPHHDETAAPEQADALHSTTDRFWLYDRLHDFLRSSSVSEPRVLVIDDIHWADEASLEFLSFMAPEVASLRLLFVVTLREYEDRDGRSGHLHRLLRYTEQIQLSGLSQDSVDQFLTRSGRFEKNAELSRVFFAKTGGNPLFIHETFRWLTSKYSDPKKELTAEDLQNLDVPDVIKELIQRRLDTVDRQAREVLDLASVMGRNVELGLVSQILQHKKRTLVTALEQTADAGLVTRESAARFRFSHDLIREVAYEILAGATRADYHNRIAEALLKRADRDAVMGEVAFHLHSALPLSDINSIITCAKKAAALSASVYAYGDAATYYRWALEAATFGDSTEPRAQAELLFALSDCERASGDAERSLTTMDKALQVARAHAYYDIVVDIVYLKRRTFLASHIPIPTELEALQEAVEHVPEEDMALRSRLLGQLALTHPYSWDMPLCKKTCQQAIGLAEASGDRQSISMALNSALYCLSGPDDIDALLGTVERILQLQSKGESTAAGREALLARIMTFIHRGDMAGAERSTEEYGAAMQQTKMAEGVWFYRRLVAQSAFHQGRFDEATKSYAELAEHGRRIGIYYAEMFHQAQAGNVLRECEGMGGLIQADGDAILEASRAWSLALPRTVALLAEAGFSEMVQKDYQQLVAENFEDIPRNFTWLNTLTNFVLSSLIYDDQPRIRRLYELLSPYAEFNTPDGMFLCEGSVAHFLAMLAARLDKDDEATRYFEQALEANRRMKMFPYLARTQVVFAEWLAGKDAKKHRARVQALADEALGSAREMSMAPLLRRAEALLGT